MRVHQSVRAGRLASRSLRSIDRRAGSRVAVAVGVVAASLVLPLAVVPSAAAPPAAPNLAGHPETATLIGAGRLHAVAVVNGQARGWGNGSRAGVPVMNADASNTGVTAMAVGWYHTLVVRSGGVEGWGENEERQLNIPTSLTSGVTSVAAGRSHSLALKGGRVVAWGAYGDDVGQTDVPRDASTGVTAIAAGAYHGLALKGGKVIGWGPTGGDQDFDQAKVPDLATSNVTAIAASWKASLAIRDGRVLAWGADRGAGRLLPLPPALSDSSGTVTAIAANSEFGLAVEDGRLIAWNLATGAEAPAVVPDAVRNSHVTAISAGDLVPGLTGWPPSIYVAIADGAVTAWLGGRAVATPGSSEQGVRMVDVGTAASVVVDGNDVEFNGVSRDGAANIESVDGASVTDVAVSTVDIGTNDGVVWPRGTVGANAVALVNGGVKVFGDSSKGQNRVPDAAKRGVSAVDAGGGFVVAVKGGKVLTWGSIGSTVPSSLRSGVTDVAAGHNYALAIRNGGVVAWNRSGVLPVPRSVASGVTSIAAGQGSAVAVANGAVVSWNPSTGATQSVPATVAGAQSVAAGRAHAVALVNGKAIAWGLNTKRQAPSLVRAEAQTIVVRISAGGDSSSAVRLGSHYGWGDDAAGQLTGLPPTRFPLLTAAADGKTVTWTWDANQPSPGRSWSGDLSGTFDCDLTVGPSTSTGQCSSVLANYDDSRTVTFQITYPATPGYLYVPSRPVATVGTSDAKPVTTPLAPPAPTVVAGDRTLTVSVAASSPLTWGECSTQPTMQYSLDAEGTALDRDWQTSPEFTRLTNGTEYTAYARQTIAGLPCARGLPGGMSPASSPSAGVVRQPYGAFPTVTVTSVVYGKIVYLRVSVPRNSSGLSGNLIIGGTACTNPPVLPWTASAPLTTTCTGTIFAPGATKPYSVRLRADLAGGVPSLLSPLVSGTAMSLVDFVPVPTPPTISAVRVGDRRLTVVATPGTATSCDLVTVEYSRNGFFWQKSNVFTVPNGEPQTIRARSTYEGTDCENGARLSTSRVSSTTTWPTQVEALGPLGQPTISVSVRGSKITWRWNANQGDNGRDWVATIRGEGKTFTILPGQRQTGSWTKNFGTSTKLRTMTITVRADGLEKKASKSARPQ